MNAPDPHTPYDLEIDVKPGDIDQLGHVNNVIYLEWVQRAAIAHWSAVATEEEQRGLFWVVSRHEIDYIRPAFADDRITARTRVGEARGRAFERHTDLIRQGDDKLLARVRTLWCPVDPRTLRPTDVDEAIYRRFSVNHGEQ